jgi:hypothetical protein
LIPAVGHDRRELRRQQLRVATDQVEKHLGLGAHTRAHRDHHLTSAPVVTADPRSFAYRIKR